MRIAGLLSGHRAKPYQEPAGIPIGLTHEKLSSSSLATAGSICEDDVADVHGVPVVPHPLAALFQHEFFPKQRTRRSSPGRTRIRWSRSPMSEGTRPSNDENPSMLLLHPDARSWLPLIRLTQVLHCQASKAP